MNILMLNYEYPPLGGGAAPVTKSLAEELVHRGHEVDIVTMGFRGLQEKEVINNVHIFRVSNIRKKLEVCTTYEMLSYCFSAGCFLPKLLKKKEYDINHTHFIIPTGIISALFSERVPYIITAHGSDVPGYNPDRFQLQHKLLRPFSNLVLNRACHITSPSWFLKGEIIRTFGERQISVIPNGISPEDYTPREKQYKILTVSRLFERKGIQYVIDAMVDIEGFEYVICGDGPYRSSLERRIKHLDIGHKVHVRGYLESQQLKREYESAAIFILPSISENFPMVLLEAMAAGCAIITTDTTGCSEVVGNTALRIRPQDSEDVKQKLLTLINDPNLLKTLGRKGRERVENEFTWNRVAETYIALYNNVLNRRDY